MWRTCSAWAVHQSPGNKPRAWLVCYGLCVCVCVCVIQIDVFSDNSLLHTRKWSDQAFRTYPLFWRWPTWWLTSLRSSPSSALVQCQPGTILWRCTGTGPRPQVGRCTETKKKCPRALSPLESRRNWSALCRLGCSELCHPDPRRPAPGPVLSPACLSTARRRTGDL